VFLCQWTGQDYPETSLPTSVPKIPNMMNLGLGAITAHGDMPDLALALRGNTWRGGESGAGPSGLLEHFRWRVRRLVHEQGHPSAAVHETSPQQRSDLAEPVAAIRLAAAVGLLARIVGTIPPDPEAVAVRRQPGH
jgi:hypothetical protein